MKMEFDIRFDAIVMVDHSDDLLGGGDFALKPCNYTPKEIFIMHKVVDRLNAHDKLVESLREVIDLSKSPREHKEARERASKLLAELENNDAQRDW